MIIFLGGIQAINPALYEAAEMDHATPWQKFKDITLPELKPLCIFVFITITIGAFRMLVQPMVMTGGGPGTATELMATYMYKNAFVQFNMGYGSAVAAGMFILITVLSLFTMRMINGKKEEA